MTRRRAVRVTAIGSVAVLAATLVVVLVLVITLIRRPMPDRGEDVELAGLQGSVTVLRDEQGVPQIYADTAADLMRAQGYVHAQDRFFEMDLRRHITAGRLSELVGADDDALSADAVVRTLGWRRVAQQELTQVTPATRSYLEAYADGVNDYIRGRSASQLSVSYTLLARANPLPRIEPWTPVDSLAWLKAMAWDLRTNYDAELERASAITTVRDVGRVTQLYPSYPFDQHEPIIQGPVVEVADPEATKGSARTVLTSPPRAQPAEQPVQQPVKQPVKQPVADIDGLRSALLSEPGQRAVDDAAEAAAAVPSLLGKGSGLGSNSWVISGRLSATGKPLLANDPHLGTSMPGIWHQVGLHCRQLREDCPFDVSGFSFAGLPGVVIGHNRRIAWGLTNMYADVTDFYLERTSGDQVEYGGALTPLTVRTETIAVAGEEPVTLTVRSSSHGPLLSDVIDGVGAAGQSAPVAGEEPDRSTRYDIALSWTALQPGRSMDALFAMDAATSFEGFRQAALLLDAPAQNMIYADVDGRIGYQAPGRIPVRGAGREGAPVPADGTWPHPGWDKAYDWTGTVPVRRLPSELDPSDGFIVAANQAVTGPGGSLQLTRDWDYGYRAQRINSLLERAAAQGRALTVADMQSMQADTRNGIAAQLVPLLLKIEDSDSFTREAVDLLRGWDYTQPADSAAAAYFNVVWATVLSLTFSDELPVGSRPDGGDRWFEVVRTLLAQPKDPWWDDRGTPNVVESRDEVLRRALTQARLQLTSTLGKDPERWEWGRLHRLRLQQTPLGGEGAPGLLHSLVNRGPYPAPGGSALVNAFAWDASTNSFDVTAAPSMRMVVDLGNLDRSRWVNQTGVSGHPAEDHYDDQIEAWLDGQDFPWPFSESAVREAADEQQTFSAPAEQ